MHKRMLLGLLLGLSVLWAGGCAQDVGDIDRTQPNKLKKEVFEGEWYMRQTIVGTPGTGSVTFIGYESQMERVRFEVQESLLVAHRAHEDVLGIDSADVPPVDGTPSPAYGADVGAEDWIGAPVAAFPIQQHFDIQRQYNSATGEQMNVIMENMSDRDWLDRDYVRVNWRNSIFSGANDMYVAIDRYSSASWYEDGVEENTPIYVECRDIDGNFYDCDPENLADDDQIAYLEVTNAYVIYPNWVDCILTFGYSTIWGGSCGPETIEIRTSFNKIDPEEANDYEPRLYSDHEMEWFGFFRTERCVQDRLYGCRDDTILNMINRHNIWQEWYTDTNENGAYDEGERLDFTERDVRPIVYYVTENTPADVLDDILDISEQYNDHFTSVVKEVNDANFDGRMFYVCANSGSEEERAKLDAAEAAGLFGLDFVEAGADATSAEEIWSGLTQGYDDGFCLREGKAKRVGDVRYNFFAWVHQVQQNGPLGYGPSSTDPITGETVAANAYIYGGFLDIWAQSAVDMAEMLNGNLDAEAFGYGENVDGYVKDIHERFHIPQNGFMGAPSNELTASDVVMLEAKVVKFGALSDRLRSPEDMERHAQMDLAQVIRHQDTHISLWERMKGTEVEVRAITPEIKVGLGAGVFAPDSATTDETVEALSMRKIGMMPGHGMQRPDLQGDSSRNYSDRITKFSSRNMFMAEFIDDGMVKLALDLNERFGHIEDRTERTVKMFYYVRSLVYKHVTEHEVGHTVGLRHNFAASTDAMSFDPEYWNIRFEGDEQLANSGLECPGIEDLNLGDHHCPTRGYIDQDHRKGMKEYAYTSTMDYGQKHTSNSHGLGLYDIASIHYGYGDLVHVFSPGAEPTKFGMTVGNFGEMIGVPSTTDEVVTDWRDIDHVVLEDGSDYVYDWGLEYWHYTVLTLLFGGDANGNMDQMYDRTWMPLDEYNVESPSALRVPYRMYSDFLRGANPWTQVWDDGADFNEIVQNYIDTYQNYYFINSYRRGRAAWGLWVWPHISRIYGRYFSPIASMYQHMYLRWVSWDNMYYSNAYASGLQQDSNANGLAAMLEVLGNPHPGTYVQEDHDGDGIPTYFNISSDPEAVAVNNAGLPVAESEVLRLQPSAHAKWRITRFDYDSGYYWFLKYQILSSFWDRWAAFMAITNPEANSVGVDASSDIQGAMIPYYLMYSYELSTAFGGIMTEDFNGFSPLVNLAKVTDGGIGVDAVETRDPLASVPKRIAYKDPTQYIAINPYPGVYGNQGFNDRYFAAMYGLALFQVLYDQSFNHASNIFILNDGGAGAGFADSDGDGMYDIQEGYEDEDGDGIAAFLDPDEQPATPAAMPEFVTYEDPFNHKVYAAVKYIEPGSPLYSPGVRILERANMLKDDWLEGVNDVSSYDVQNIREDIETIMLLNNVFSDTGD